MNRLLSLLLVSLTVIFYFSGCDKKVFVYQPGQNIDSAFVKQLMAKCGNRFVAMGDSGMYALPTAFTPNSDGKNDVFYLLGYPYTFTTFQLSIFRTKGVRVFNTTNPATQWVGTDTVGAICVDYRYYVTIKYTTPGGKSVDTGTFLFRLPNGSSSCVNRTFADTTKYFFPDQFDPTTGTFPYATMEVFCR